MITLSEETTDLITVLFSDTNQQEIKDTLVDCCDYLTSSGLKEDMDRICFAILKLSVTRKKGRINRFHKAIDLARLDYRDLLVDAGFGNDVKIHEKWADRILNLET